MVAPIKMPASVSFKFNAWVISGYTTIAMVLRVVTPITVNSVSCFSLSLPGSTLLIAIAAEAPQMPTEPPVKTPSWVPKPIIREHNVPNAIVSKTPTQTPATGSQPSSIRSVKVIRNPNSATPRRKICVALSSIPGTTRGFSMRKWKARPNSSPMSIAGAP